MASRALIAGVTGLIGSKLADHLLSKGWEVYGLARKLQGGIPGIRPIADARPTWAKIAAKHGLAEADLGKLASPWHTDLDLGREIEVLTDMTKSRLAGFHEYQPTLRFFQDLFAKLRKDRIIPV